MKILLTGGLGYIGSTLLDTLIETTDHEVTIIDKQMFHPKIGWLSKFYCDPRVKIRIHDLDNAHSVYEEIKKSNVVIHLAGLRLEECEANPDSCYFTNELLTKMLAQMCVMLNRKLVFSSTCSNYGMMGKKMATEESKLDPTTHYAKSKVNAEKYLMNIPNATIMRFATAYGVGSNITREDTLLNAFVKDAIRKGELDIFMPHAHRPLLHVKDIAKAIITLIDNPEKQHERTYNVGTLDQNFEKIEIASKIADITKCSIKTTEKDDPRDYTVDFRLFKRRFGFSADHNLNDSIKELVTYYEKQKAVAE